MGLQKLHLYQYFCRKDADRSPTAGLKHSRNQKDCFHNQKTDAHLVTPVKFGFRCLIRLHFKEASYSKISVNGT